MPTSFAPASSLSWLRSGWNSTWLVTRGTSTIGTASRIIAMV